MLSANDSNCCARSFLICAGLAIMANAGYSATVLEMNEAQKAARALSLESVAVEIRRNADIAPAFETLIRGGAHALYVCTDPLVSFNLARINTLALGGRLPTMHGVREYVEAGGLMSYGANGVPLSLSTKFCAARDRQIFPSSSRSNSISS